MLVFHDADPQAQFDRHAGLALADPFGVRLEHGKHFLLMGDGFSENDPSSRLVDLTLRMFDERLDLDLGRQVLDARHYGLGQCLPCLVQIALGDLQGEFVLRRIIIETKELSGQAGHRRAFPG